MYHKVCSGNFLTKKQIPAVHQHEMSTSKRAKVGRPKYKERTDAFLVANFLEENEEQITFNDLICRMEDNLADSEYDAYSYVHMQLNVLVEELLINGKPNVVTFRNKAMTSIVIAMLILTYKRQIDQG